MIGIEGVNGLVGRAKEFFKAEFARAAAEAAGVGQAEEFESGVVDQLQSVVAVEGEQRSMHDFEDAGEQGRGLKRAHSLFLEQVGESIDLRGQFADSIGRESTAGAEGVVAFAQGRDNVGKRLQRADKSLNECGGSKREIQEQTAAKKQRGRKADVAFVEAVGGESQCRERKHEAMEPRPVHDRAPPPARLRAKIHGG